jgi:hypothetical protein
VTSPSLGRGPNLLSIVSALVAVSENDLPYADKAAAGSAGDGSKSAKDAAGQRRMRPQPWWLIFLVVVTVNYMARRVFFPEPSSMVVS